MRKKITFHTINLLVLFILLLTGFFFWIKNLLYELPSYEKLEEYQPSLTTIIYDRNGEVIDEFFIEKRRIVPLSEIPVDLQNAIIAIEDNQFFRHWGVNLYRLFRALLVNIQKRRFVQGASTITQQLARSLFLTREKTIKRKIKEALLAIQLERTYTKEEILQLYFNQIYFGNGAYGIQTAAKVYFNKDVKELTLPECALLAGLPRAPGIYSPYKSLFRAYKRRKLVLRRMYNLGFISKEEMENANKSPIILAKEAYRERANAPYFVEYIRQILEPKYGTNVLFKGGLKIYTSLDLTMQKVAEEVLERHLSRFDEEKKKEMEEEGLTNIGEKEVQGAILVIDPKSGQIRVMVGGRDFKQSQFNRAVQAKRQPGSAFKPFIYTAAIDSGYTVVSLIDDSPVAYYNDGINWKLLSRTTDLSDINPEILQKIDPEKIWIPRNYGEKFGGPTLLRDALIHSKNVCSVKLLEKIRPETAVRYARKMGIVSPLEKTLSLALGASDLTLLEITNAFCVLDNQGIKVKPYAITKVEDNQGNILEENLPIEKEVLSPQTCYIVTHLLQEVCEYGTGWYTRYLGKPRAGKTGTTNDFTDAWFIGFVPNLACGVWVGYDDHSSLGDKKAGGVVAAPIWTEFMKKVLENKPVLDFPVPKNIVFVRVDPKTGLLAFEDSSEAVLEPFLKGTEPKDYFLTEESPVEEK